MLTGGAVSVRMRVAISRKASAAAPVPLIATGSPESPPAATLASIGTRPRSSTPISCASVSPPPEPNSA